MEHQLWTTYMLLSARTCTILSVVVLLLSGCECVGCCPTRPAGALTKHTQVKKGDVAPHQKHAASTTSRGYNKHPPSALPPSGWSLHPTRHLRAQGSGSYTAAGSTFFTFVHSSKQLTQQSHPLCSQLITPPPLLQSCPFSHPILTRASETHNMQAGGGWVGEGHKLPGVLPFLQ